MPPPLPPPSEVLRVDDHELARFGMATLLHGSVLRGSIGLILEAASVDAARALVNAQRIDPALIDLPPVNITIGNCAVNGITAGNDTVGRVTYDTGGSHTGTLSGTSTFPGITGTIAPTTLSGLTVDAGATIPCDVVKYVGAKGVAQLTYTQGVPVTTNCGGAPVQRVALLYPMSTDCPNNLANSQEHTDPAKLSGSVNGNCSSHGLDLGTQMTWSLTQCGRAPVRPCASEPVRP